MITEIFNKDCEKILHFQDDKLGMEAIIAIDDTTLGPAIGGCRLQTYSSTQNALHEVTQLAKAMKYKAALANLNNGGGKSVILASESITKKNRVKCFSAFGEILNQLGGKYITAIDSGTDTADMKIIRTTTPYVTGYATQVPTKVDPSLYTAKTVLQGILAGAEHHYGSINLKGKKVLIKGVGHVGSHLANFLAELGADIYITDIDKHKISFIKKHVHATAVNPLTALHQRYDIICPCDLAYTVTFENINSLQTDIISGGTNNQLEDDILAGQLLDKGITYCPDYAVNSGGLIYIAGLYENKSSEYIAQQIQNVYTTTKRILDLAVKKSTSTKLVADQIVHNRLNRILLEQHS